MSPATYIPKQRRAEIRRDLEKAALGRIYAEKIRGASLEAQREQARAARNAGLSVAEIARLSHCSLEKIYTFLKGDK
jgi:hypothetical protein